MNVNICMIAYTHYSCDTRVMREAETLASLEGYSVTFIVPREEESPKNYVMNKVNVQEINIQTYQGKSKLRYLVSYLHFFLRVFYVSTMLFFRRKIDVFHIHNMPDFLVFVAVIPRLFGKKIILDLHDTLPETYASKFGRKKTLLVRAISMEEALSCSFAHKIICVNHPQSEVVIKRGVPREKITVCMNVPDHKKFNSTVCNISGKDPLRFKIVYHGTLARRLGIDFTIQAVERLKEKIPNLEFHVIGYGDDMGSFVKLSQNLELDKIVLFRGMIKASEIPSALCEMDMGVVANRVDSATELMLPVKMMEYISLNIPVVVPRLKTIQYYFSEDMVTYFDPENIDSLAEAIFKLYSDKDQRERQVRKSRKFMDEYGWENHQFNLLNLYKEIIQEK